MLRCWMSRALLQPSEQGNRQGHESERERVEMASEQVHWDKRQTAFRVRRAAHIRFHVTSSVIGIVIRDCDYPTMIMMRITVIFNCLQFRHLPPPTDIIQQSHQRLRRAFLFGSRSRQCTVHISCDWQSISSARL